MTRSSWILGSWAADGPLILLPGLLAFPVFYFVSERLAVFTVLALLTSVVIDTGHVYSTLWRTYFRGEERQSSPVYWVTPLCILAVMIPWFAYGLPYAWSFVVYATMFHHFRQYYGMLRWYERLNARPCRPSQFFLYALTIGPFIILHFRPEPRLRALSYYTTDAIFLSPDPDIWRFGLAAYALVWCAWAGYEAYLLSRGLREWNRILAILGPSVLAGLCFLTGVSRATLILPMIVNHGIPYLSVMSLTLRRLDPGRFKTVAWSAGLIVASAAVFGGLEQLLTALFLTVDNNYAARPIGLWRSALLGIYLVPLFCHYVLDAHIWTGRHREAKVVYAAAGR